MVSRKTYFGIGWKDPTNPEPGAPAKPEPEDRSAPTVVDDEQVAEGLRQLRSWYQGDEQTGGDRGAEPAAGPTPLSNPLVGSQARPTAVGHATNPLPATQPRPMAPDPMRATMYGHDVHQFDLEAAKAAAAAVEQQTPASVGTALVVAEKAPLPLAEAVPSAGGRSPVSEPFQLASFGHGEAERLHRPGRRSGSYEAPPRPRLRLPTLSNIVFGLGIAALTAAVFIWIQMGSGADSPAAAPTPQFPQQQEQQPAPPSPMPTPGVTPASAQTPAVEAVRPPAPPADKGQIVPARSPAKSSTAPAPIPPATVATAASQRVPTAATKPLRRHKDPKPEAETAAAADSDDSTTPSATTAPTDDDQPKQTEPKELKETKARSTGKEPKEPKAAKEPKDSKDRSIDSDATLPPSLE